MRKVVAVIPAYNEGARIGNVIENTRQYVDEVIVVDDHSADNTFDIAIRAKANAVRLVSNMGAGFATRIGCDAAIGAGADTIVTLDADGQHDPAEIPRLLTALRKRGLDIVFGSRPRDDNMPVLKRVGNYGLSLIASLLFAVNVKDSQTGFHAFTKEAYPKLRWRSSRYGMVSEFIHNVGRYGLAHGEVKVRTIYTEKRGGMRKRDALKSALNMFWWRFREW